jgi:hypothetical protein
MSWFAQLRYRKGWHGKTLGKRSASEWPIDAGLLNGLNMGRTNVGL